MGRGRLQRRWNHPRSTDAPGRPFFLFVPYTQTHYPVLQHPDLAGKTGNGRWADVLAQVDAYNGMLLDAIDDLGIRDNTLFIFTADNGPEAFHANPRPKESLSRQLSRRAQDDQQSPPNKRLEQTR